MYFYTANISLNLCWENGHILASCCNLSNSASVLSSFLLYWLSSLQRIYAFRTAFEMPLQGCGCRESSVVFGASGGSLTSLWTYMLWQAIFGEKFLTA